MRPAMIGVFDSGVGGLSVWREIARQRPCADLLYVADHAHCPYGVRSADEIRALAEGITAFLITCGAHVIVVACNTASAAALHHLRQRFSVPIVGMEPAVKPAALHTRTGHVGVIATPVTFQGALFASLLERFAQDVTVHTQVCPGLVEQVEAGALEGPETLALLRRYLDPLLDKGIDALVLGCTHYSFLRQSIAQIVGPEVEIIDPAPAVARQTVRVLSRSHPESPRECRGARILYTSGETASFRRMVGQLLGNAGQIRGARWRREGGFPVAVEPA